MSDYEIQIDFLIPWGDQVCLHQVCKFCIVVFKSVRLFCRNERIIMDSRT